MKVNVYLYKGALNKINNDAIEALKKTADAVKSDLVQGQTMPFDTGALQNRNTFVDDSNINKGQTSIVSDTPYARRMYYHPEYNFQTGKNSKAGGMWFEPYINGNKKNFAQNTFKKLMRETYK